jgi:hypothetical protein
VEAGRFVLKSAFHQSKTPSPFETLNVSSPNIFQNNFPSPELTMSRIYQKENSSTCSPFKVTFYDRKQSQANNDDILGALNQDLKPLKSPLINAPIRSNKI